MYVNCVQLVFSSLYVTVLYLCLCRGRLPAFDRVGRLGDREVHLRAARLEPTTGQGPSLGRHSAARGMPPWAPPCGGAAPFVGGLAASA